MHCPIPIWSFLLVYCLYSIFSLLAPFFLQQPSLLSPALASSSDSSVKELSSLKFTEENILSHTFSYLLAAPATLLRKEPSLMPGSQSGAKSHQPEQDPLKYSQLNVLWLSVT